MKNPYQFPIFFSDEVQEFSINRSISILVIVFEVFRKIFSNLLGNQNKWVFLRTDFLFLNCFLQFFNYMEDEFNFNEYNLTVSRQISIFLIFHELFLAVLFNLMPHSFHGIQKEGLSALFYLSLRLYSFFILFAWLCLCFAFRFEIQSYFDLFGYLSRLSLRETLFEGLWVCDENLIGLFRDQSDSFANALQRKIALANIEEVKVHWNPFILEGNAKEEAKILSFLLGHFFYLRFFVQNYQFQSSFFPKVVFKTDFSPFIFEILTIR